MGETQKLLDLAAYYDFIQSNPFTPEYFISLSKHLLTRQEFVFLNYASRLSGFYNNLYEQAFFQAYILSQPSFTEFTPLPAVRLLQTVENGVGNNVFATTCGTKVLQTQDLVFSYNGNTFLVGGPPFTESRDYSFGCYNPYSDTFGYFTFSFSGDNSFDYYSGLADFTPNINGPTDYALQDWYY